MRLKLIVTEAAWTNKTQLEISKKTGLSRPTIKKIFEGDQSVSLGNYLKVLNELGLEFNLVQKKDKKC